MSDQDQREKERKEKVRYRDKDRLDGENQKERIDPAQKICELIWNICVSFLCRAWYAYKKVTQNALCTCEGNKVQICDCCRSHALNRLDYQFHSTYVFYFRVTIRYSSHDVRAGHYRNRWLLIKKNIYRLCIHLH